MYGYASGVWITEEDSAIMKSIRHIAIIGQRFRTILEDPEGEWGNEITQNMK